MDVPTPLCSTKLKGYDASILKLQPYNLPNEFLPKMLQFALNLPSLLQTLFHKSIPNNGSLSFRTSGRTYITRISNSLRRHLYLN